MAAKAASAAAKEGAGGGRLDAWEEPLRRGAWWLMPYWGRRRHASELREAGAGASKPCTHLCPDTEKDSCPIVSETTHVTFANDRLSLSVSLRCER